MPGADETQKDETQDLTAEETVTGPEEAAPEQGSSGEPASGSGAEGPAESEDVVDEPEIIEPELIEPPSPLDEALAANAKLQEDYDKLQSRLRAVSKAYRDLQDDMKQFRKRVEEQGKTKEELQRFQVVKTLFDPVQNLKRSLSAPGNDLDQLVQGLKLVLHQFTEGLTKLGLTEVPGEGEPFDPRFHEALAISPVSDQEQDGKVIMVHSAGYAVNGKVLQASQVIVGKYNDQPAEA